MLECPTAVCASAVQNDAHGIRESWITWGADGLKIVESAQHIVVPARRESEPNKCRLDDFAGPVRPEEAMNQEKLAAPALCLADGPKFAPTVQLVVPQALQHADGRVH